MDKISLLHLKEGDSKTARRFETGMAGFWEITECKAVEMRSGCSDCLSCCCSGMFGYYVQGKHFAAAGRSSLVCDHSALLVS